MGRRPQITCHTTDANSPSDKNGQTDGIAPLFRIYPTSTQVQVQAPAQFGEEVFQEWQDRDGNKVSDQPAFSLEIDSSQVDSHGERFLQCVYAAKTSRPRTGGPLFVVEPNRPATPAPTEVVPAPGGIMPGTPVANPGDTVVVPGYKKVGWGAAIRGMMLRVKIAILGFFRLFARYIFG